MRELEPFGVDGNGALTERSSIGGQEVILHYADVPESDITTLRGMRLTTPVRTVIDLAPEMDPADFVVMVADALARRLFTAEQAWQRLAEPDMARNKGAALLRQVLPPQR